MYSLLLDSLKMSFSPGDLIWAKMRGFRHWPARVSSIYFEIKADESEGLLSWCWSWVETRSTMISFEVFLSLFRSIFLHQKRIFRPTNSQFSSLEHTKRKLLRLLSKFISLQWSLVCNLVEIRCNILSCLFCICFGDHLTILRMQSSKTPLVWRWYCTRYL